MLSAETKSEKVIFSANVSQGCKVIDLGITWIQKGIICGLSMPNLKSLTVQENYRR